MTHHSTVDRPPARRDFQLPGVVVLQASAHEEAVIRRRDAWMRQYSRSQGWNYDRLTEGQMLQISRQPEYQDPPAVDAPLGRRMPSPAGETYWAWKATQEARNP